MGDEAITLRVSAEDADAYDEGRRMRAQEGR